MNSIQEWYNGTNPKQRILLYVVCVPLIFLYGAGLLLLAFLLYFHFGSEQPVVPHYDDNNPPPKDSPEFYDWANREGRFADKS